MAQDPARPLDARRILVVDDQPSIRKLLEVALQEAGADVWSAEDGATALRMVEDAVPDLVLLDLAMPSMSGWQVLDALRGSADAAKVPVVLQTSAEDFASFDRARKQGVAAFISKPFRLAEVVETCRRILEGARPLQGRPPLDAEPPAVQLRDVDGNLLAVGRLLDLAATGALVDLDAPLGLAQRVRLHVYAASASVQRAGEVRWVREVDGRYHHGLALREE